LVRSHATTNPGHIVPEAQNGGPIALVKNGDKITISADRLVIDLDVSDEELSQRRKEWKEPPLKYKRGTLFKYAKYSTQFMNLTDLETF
jgi:dihydroxy-acid dehydratase